MDFPLNTSSSKNDYPPKKQARNAVLILALANVLAFVDRQIPAMLVEPIKQDFDLSDSQIALLGGAAFSLFYALMAENQQELQLVLWVSRELSLRVLAIHSK